MDIIRSDEGGYVILHGGRVIDKVFPSEDAAESWADEFIDDQVFDTPNHFAPPLTYRSEAQSANPGKER